MGKYKLPEKREDVSISYVDTEKGFQLNVQSIDDIKGCISPLLKYRGSVDLKGHDAVVEIYANDEFWKQKHYLTKL